MSSKIGDQNIAEKFMYDCCEFVGILKRVAACRIENVTPANVRECFAWAHRIYEKCLIIEETDSQWMKLGNPYSCTRKYYINSKLTYANTVNFKLPCCVNFEFLKKGLDYLVEALMMNVTLQPAAVDEVVRLCNVEPYKNLITTRMASWNVSAHYRNCQTDVWKELESVLVLLHKCREYGQSSQLENDNATENTSDRNGNAAENATDRNGNAAENASDRNGNAAENASDRGGDPKSNEASGVDSGGDQKPVGGRGTSPRVAKMVEGLPYLPMQRVVSFMEKVADWIDSAEGFGWFIHFQLPGLLRTMCNSQAWKSEKNNDEKKNGRPMGMGIAKDFMVACMCINRAVIDISKRKTVYTLQEKMLDQLKIVFGEIAQKKPADKWLWLNELQEELCSRAAEEFPPFEKWYTACLETCVIEYDNNQYLPTLGTAPKGLHPVKDDFAREMSWRFFCLLQRNTEIRQKVGSILMMGQNPSCRDRPTVWTQIYKRLAKLLDQF